MKELILASKSVYRKELLERLVPKFLAIPSKLDENLLKGQEHSASELAKLLSRAKAEMLLQKNPDHIILGCDQVCFMDQQVFSKPKTKEKAKSTLWALQGKTHCLATAYTLLSEQQSLTRLNLTYLTMKKLTAPEIEAYINADLPLECAGSYMLEKKGIALFEKIETEDYTAIVGLPLMQLSSDLKTFGVDVLLPQ